MSVNPEFVENSQLTLSEHFAIKLVPTKYSISQLECIFIFYSIKWDRIMSCRAPYSVMLLLLLVAFL